VIICVAWSSGHPGIPLCGHPMSRQCLQRGFPPSRTRVAPRDLLTRGAAVVVVVDVRVRRICGVIRPTDRPHHGGHLPCDHRRCLVIGRVLPGIDDQVLVSHRSSIGAAASRSARCPASKRSSVRWTTRAAASSYWRLNRRIGEVGQVGLGACGPQERTPQRAQLTAELPGGALHAAILAVRPHRRRPRPEAAHSTGRGRRAAQQPSLCRRGGFRRRSLVVPNSPRADHSILAELVARSAVSWAWESPCCQR